MSIYSTIPLECGRHAARYVSSFMCSCCSSRAHFNEEKQRSTSREVAGTANMQWHTRVEGFHPSRMLKVFEGSS